MRELSSPGNQPLIIDNAEKGVLRVNRLAYTSDELFEREQREIYDHCWLLLGHESEIFQPGDFKTRTIALRPIIFCRGDDREVCAFINLCPHRGAELCRKIEGNRSIFHCMTRRFVSNVRLAANFMIARMRKRAQDIFIGHYDHLLKIVDGKIRFQHRRSILDLEALRSQRSITIKI